MYAPFHIIFMVIFNYINDIISQKFHFVQFYHFFWYITYILIKMDTLILILKKHFHLYDITLSLHILTYDKIPTDT